MILGRSLTLWTGAVAAVLNAVVLANFVVLTGDQVAALSGVGHALATYDLPIEGRDEWLAAARRLA